MAARRLSTTLSLLALIATLGCTTQAPPLAEKDGLGTMHFALTGTFPGIKRMKVRVYQGPVQDLKTGLKYELPCISYLSQNGADKQTAKNAFTLDRLPVRDDYAIVIDLYEDDDCKQLKVRAYRSGIHVTENSEAEAAKHPYYVQPYVLGAFTGMALPNTSLQAEAKLRACATDTDCKSVHPSATCAPSKVCVITSLFPLNGGAPRAFPTLLALSSGEIAISGGLSVADKDGNWSATNERVEVFDPTRGLFSTPSSDIDNFSTKARVALASSFPLSERSFGVVGGAAKINARTVKGGVSLKMLTESCGPTSTSCPVSKAVWHVDLGTSTATGTELEKPLALPIVQQVSTSDGPRILIAGGAVLPLPKSGDSRSNEALLCKLNATEASCVSSNSPMNAARANAATACLRSTPDGCELLLIVGGRYSNKAPLAEVYDAQANIFIEVPIAGPGKVGVVHGGHLIEVAPHKLLLLSTTTAAPLLDSAAPAIKGQVAPVIFELDESDGDLKIQATLVKLGAFAGKDSGKRALAAAIGLSDGSALLIGGIGPDGKAINDALKINADGEVVARLPLSQHRFGGAAARIVGQGPLMGCVLLAGGFDDQGGAGLVPLNHVEFFCPASK